nr:synaptobrevin, longin-like domain protein [Tanacetum cinerariifolium]
MARLAFCDYHNMIAILEKYEHNQDFYQIMDFVKASHIRYALTFNQTVYVSHTRPFWSTARIETTKDGTKILTTVDGKLRTVSESSIRRNLKHNDEAEISSFPDTKLFENLQLMGYNILPNQKFTFQKGQFFHQWKYLIHTTMQCLSPKSTGFNEFSSNIATALVCLATNRVYKFSKMIFDGMVRNVNNKVSKFLMYPRQYTRRTRIAQSLVLPPIDRANIAKTSILPSDSTPRVTSLTADEGSMQQKLNKLTSLCTSLQRQQSEMVSKFDAQELKINSLKARIKLLESKDRGVADQSGDDALIKGRRLDEGEEAAKRVSDDTEEMATVLTSMDAASILTSGGVQVVPTAVEVATATVSIPTGSGVVSTASPIIPTAAPIFTTATESTPYIRKKGKEKMVESITHKKKKLQEQIDEYEQIPEDLSIGERIELISDLVKYQENYAQVLKYQTIQRKLRSKKQKKDYYMAVIKGHVGWKTNDFKGMLFEQKEAKFNTVWKQIEDFIPMGSKEEAKRFKRKGLRLEHESAKKLKTSEEVHKEVKSSEEVPEEKVKEMMQLRSYWKIIRLGGSSSSYQFFVDMLKHFDREDLNQLWALVKESLRNRPATTDKEKELWVELKRLFESDVEDYLGTHTQNLMHAPLEWKLYDTYGVHHVSTRDQDIFMLIEKDYPLRKGLALVMICYKLQVENYSQMANDLILKIYKIINNIMVDVNVNAPADQAPTMAPPTRTDDQILPHIRWILHFICLMKNLFLDISSLVLRGTKREVFRMPIPNKLITADIQGEQYYQEYLDKVAKHQGYLSGEKGSGPDSPAPKPTKATKKSKPSKPKADLRTPVTKPALSQQLKPKPAPTKSQGKKRKLVTETSDKPSQGKRSKPGLVTKRRNPTSSLRLVDESVDEGNHEKEPRFDDEESDIQRAMEESLTSVYDAPRGLFLQVVIREPDSRKFQPLPEVQGKGKEKVSDEHVGHDLLTLQTPKKVSLAEQCIFQRHTPTSNEPSGQDESSLIYAAIGFTDSASESDEEVPSVVKVEAQDEGQAGPNPGVLTEGQAGPNPGVLTESQAGSDPGENLKLTVEEQAILEEPASSAWTLSSLQHIAKDFSLGDLFFNDKPSEAENEKTAAETKAESMVFVTIQQDTSAIPPMTTPRIGKLEQIMANLIQDNKYLEERLDSHGARLYILENLDIPHQETNSYKAHEDHMMLYEALEKFMNRDHTDELLKDLAEARKKKKKRRDSPNTPLGSPPHQPPPPPPLAGPSGTLESPGASRSSQVPPPPPPPPSTNQEGQSHGSTAPSSSKTVSLAKYTAWMTTDTRLGQSISLILEDLHMDDDMAPDVQPLEEDRHATLEPNWSIPSSDLPVLTNNWASALASTYTPPPEDSLLAQTGDMEMFMDWFCKRQGITEHKPQDLEGHAFKLVKVFHPNDKYGVQMIMRFNEIHKFSDGTLHQIDVALDYRVKEFKVAVCSSLRSLKPKRTIDSRAKRSSRIISLGHYSIMLASLHTVKTKTDIKSPRHYPRDQEGSREVPKMRIEAKNHEKGALEVVTRRTNPKTLIRPVLAQKNNKCFNAAGEELSAVKHKLMLMHTAVERRVNTAQ